MLIHGLFYTGSKTNKNLFNRQTHCILLFKSCCLLKTKPTLKVPRPIRIHADHDENEQGFNLIFLYTDR